MSDSIPVAELFKSVGVNGISVTSTTSQDLLEQTTVNLANVNVPINQLSEVIGVNGISVTATNLADILEQITVNLATSTAPITETLVPISITALSASPTYVYSDGAPVAAPAPGEQVVEQWSIT
jgi:hypothetical protein